MNLYGFIYNNPNGWLDYLGRDPIPIPDGDKGGLLPNTDVEDRNDDGGFNGEEMPPAAKQGPAIPRPIPIPNPIPLLPSLPYPWYPHIDPVTPGPDVSRHAICYGSLIDEIDGGAQGPVACVYSGRCIAINGTSFDDTQHITAPAQRGECFYCPSTLTWRR